MELNNSRDFIVCGEVARFIIKCPEEKMAARIDNFEIETIRSSQFSISKMKSVDSFHFSEDDENNDFECSENSQICLSHFIDSDIDFEEANVIIRASLFSRETQDSIIHSQIRKVLGGGEIHPTTRFIKHSSIEAKFKIVRPISVFFDYRMVNGSLICTLKINSHLNLKIEETYLSIDDSTSTRSTFTEKFSILKLNSDFTALQTDEVLHVLYSIELFDTSFTEFTVEAAISIEIHNCKSLLKFRYPILIESSKGKPLIFRDFELEVVSCEKDKVLLNLRNLSQNSNSFVFSVPALQDSNSVALVPVIDFGILAPSATSQRVLPLTNQKNLIKLQYQNELINIFI